MRPSENCGEESRRELRGGAPRQPRALSPPLAPTRAFGACSTARSARGRYGGARPPRRAASTRARRRPRRSPRASRRAMCRLTAPILPRVRLGRAGPCASRPTRRGRGAPRRAAPAPSRPRASRAASAARTRRAAAPIRRPRRRSPPRPPPRRRRDRGGGLVVLVAVTVAEAAERAVVVEAGRALVEVERERRRLVRLDRDANPPADLVQPLAELHPPLRLLEQHGGGAARVGLRRRVVDGRRGGLGRDLVDESGGGQFWLRRRRNRREPRCHGVRPRGADVESSVF